MLTIRALCYVHSTAESPNANHNSATVHINQTLDRFGLRASVSQLVFYDRIGSATCALLGVVVAILDLIGRRDE